MATYDSTMTNDDSQHGGPEWERNEAAKKIAAGLQDGNHDAIFQGASDLGDAVVNTVISKAFKSLERTLDIVLEQHIGPIAKHQVALGTKQNELKHEVIRRLDASNDAQENLVTAIGEVRSDVGKFAADIASALDRIGTLEERADRQEVRESARDGRIAAVEQRLSVTETRLSAVEEAQASLRHEHQRLLGHLERDKRLLKSINEESNGEP